MTSDTRFIIAANHPSFEGHFPDNPIVPGAVLLDEVSQHIEPYSSIISAKFIASVLPGEKCLIVETKRTTERLYIEVHVAGRLVMKMVLALP